MEVLETREIQCCFFGTGWRVAVAGSALRREKSEQQRPACRLPAVRLRVGGTPIKPGISALVSGWFDPNEPTGLFLFGH